MSALIAGNAMLESLLPWAAPTALLSYPMYVLIMAMVLRICGVPRRDVAKWALRQADRHRITELIRVARGPLDAARDRGSITTAPPDSPNQGTAQP